MPVKSKFVTLQQSSVRKITSSGYLIEAERVKHLKLNIILPLGRIKTASVLSYNALPKIDYRKTSGVCRAETKFKMNKRNISQ